MTAPAPLPYNPRILRLLGPLQRKLIPANRLLLPLLRANLGALISNPLTGYLLILRTRGRRTGQLREAPLGYRILDGAVYCCAGLGASTAWYRNLLADPRVEVVLPGRTFHGLAEPVTDPDEWLRAYRALMASLGLVSRSMLGDLGRVDDATLLARHRSLPLVRIRPDGIVAGELDPGGRGWLAAAGAWLVGLVLLRRLAGRLMGGRPARCAAS